MAIFDYNTIYCLDSQLRGEICGHGAPIQKKKEKVARKRKKTS